MSLGTIHSNLYKSDGKDGKRLLNTVNNLNISLKSSLFLLSFLVFGSIFVIGALAAHNVIVTVNDGTDRIVGTESPAVTLTFNVTNLAGSADITLLNITNATNYNISTTTINATGNSTNACTAVGSAYVTCGGAGFSIPAGTSRLINVTTGTPAAGSSGPGTWTVNTTDSAAAVVSRNVYTLAVDLGQDIGFDVEDELGNVTPTAGAIVRVQNTSTSGPQMGASSAVEKTDSDNDGLVIFEFGSDISGASGSGTFLYNVSKQGFVNRTATGISYNRGSSFVNGVKPTGVLYGIKITVVDELGNALSTATVNVTQLPTVTTGYNTTTPNATRNNVQYFALPASFTNATFIVQAAGFLDNTSYPVNNITSGVWSINASDQATGNSTYVMFYKLKVTVADELGSGSAFVPSTTNVTFLINNTVATANTTSSNVYYFSIPDSVAINLNVSKAGYVNRSTDNILVNSTNASQSVSSQQLNFTLKVTAVDELNSGAVFINGVTIALNGTDSTANSTSSNSYYFNLTWASVNVSVAKSGYINSTNDTQVLLNASLQAARTARMNFTIRVTDVCDELSGLEAGHCYSLDAWGNSTAEVSAATGGSLNTTYNSNDAYINATNGPSAATVVINVSKNGFVNRSLSVIVNQTTQVRIVVNGSDLTGSATDRADGLLFTFKVLSLYDELGGRNFTLNTTILGTKFSAGVDPNATSGQTINVFFNTTTGIAFANITGISAVDLVAFAANQSWINRTVSVTPNPSRQQTVLFNSSGNSSSNGLGADVIGGGLQYILNITVQDELGAGNSTYMSGGLTIAFNSSGSTSLVNTTADGQRNNRYLFTNVSIAVLLANETNFTVSKIGYVNTSSPIAVPLNGTTQARLTIQLPFNLKTAANDELGEARGTSVNFTINGTGNHLPNATSGVYAYYAIPIASLATGGSAYVNMSKVGYVDNGTAVELVNTSAQALANRSLLYTVRVFLACDELNSTCFTLNGNLNTDGTAAAEVAGVSTNYSAGVAYIPASNYSITTVTVASRGYVNTTTTFWPSTTTRNSSVMFNVSAAGGTTTTINASALNYTVVVLSVCDQLNYTCFNLNGSWNDVQAAGINISGSPVSATVNSTKYNTTNNRAYIPVPGTSAVNLVAFSRGYINSTQSVTPTPGSGQVQLTWNSSVYGLNYSVRATVRDEFMQSSNMDTGVLLNRNFSAGGGGVQLVENVSYFRSAPTSNVYYLNVTTDTINVSGGANITARREGYINTSSANFNVNTSSQAQFNLDLPFSVRIRVRDSTGTSFGGATVELMDAGSNTFIVNDGNTTMDTLYNSTTLVANSTAGQGDNSTNNEGEIYWALNQSNVTNNVDVLVIPNRNGYREWRITAKVLNFGSQLTIVSANHKDVLPPAATSGATATQLGKSVQVSWTASTDGEVGSYRIYRNNTLLGTTAANTTVYTDFPTLGNTTAPGAPSSVTNTQDNGTITVSWTAPANATYVYHVTTVDKAGNPAASNSSTGAFSISNVKHYLVYRNTSLLLGTTSTTSYTDSPSVGVYYYNVTTVSDADVQSAINGSSSTIDTRDTTAPAAATSPSATISGKQVQLSWTASTSSDVSYYRVYRNATLLGTSSTTGSVDSPTLGDSTTPGAASSVSASQSGTEVQITWTVPTNFIYSYNISTVDTSGNAATSNATVTASVNPAKHYLVYRNNTLLGTSSTTSFSDTPGAAGIYTYAVTTVSDGNVSASSNGTSSVNTLDTTAPAAASSLSGTVSGKQVQLSWTASTSSDVSYYRVYRNATFIGTSTNTTGFVDSPTSGDSTAPGAPSSPTTSQLNGTITISWTAPANSVFVYNVTAVDTAGNLASSNATSSGASVSPVAYYRVARNETLVGTSSTTSFTDAPPRGVYTYNISTVSDAAVTSSTNATATALDTRDTTAPAAATSPSATILVNNNTYREVQITWTASTSSDVSYYRVSRNATLLGTSSTTTFTDHPNAGIFVYNITTVDTSGNLASTNGTSGSVSLGELIPPTTTITSPSAGSNVTTTTPTITFTVIDNDGGVGVDITTIAVNISGFNATRDCLRYNDLNYTCSYTTSALTDSSNHTIAVAAKDKFSNAATNATRSFGVDSRDGVTATLNTSDTSAIADNTYANGWSFTFNITLGSTTANATDVNATAVRVANWTRVGGTETIATAGNTVMNYTMSNGTAATYYASHNYNTTATIYPLQDLHVQSVPINGTVTIYVKIPASTTPGTYTTTFTFGSYNVTLAAGGNPS